MSDVETFKAAASVKFWPFVSMGEPDVCWNWTGGRDHGYGRVYLPAKREVLAHKFAWVQQNGVVPDGHVVCHTCPSKLCVNTRHLVLRSQEEATHVSMAGRPRNRRCQDLKPKFEKYVDRTSSPIGCWLWTGSCNARGYGQLHHAKRGDVSFRGAHKWSWTLHRGVVPAGMWVLHKCDNPPCVNPDHLFLGTPLDNARDMAAKARQVFQKDPTRAARGEASGNAKLTEAQVVAIRQSGASHSVLARALGVTPSLIHAVRTRRVWAHVKP
jgi:hypothetical protein